VAISRTDSVETRDRKKGKKTIVSETEEKAKVGGKGGTGGVHHVPTQETGGKKKVLTRGKGCNPFVIRHPGWAYTEETKTHVISEKEGLSKKTGQFRKVRQDFGWAWFDNAARGKGEGGEKVLGRSPTTCNAPRSSRESIPSEREGPT